VGKTLVLMKRHVLDEAENRRGAQLFSRALLVQSAVRRLVARGKFAERKRAYEEFRREQVV
jgi:myosin heavy subunit